MIQNYAVKCARALALLALGVGFLLALGAADWAAFSVFYTIALLTFWTGTDPALAAFMLLLFAYLCWRCWGWWSRRRPVTKHTFFEIE